MTYGWGNGYVLLPTNHPYHGVDYDDIPIQIHGGLTFGEKFNSDGFLEWVGDMEIFGSVDFNNCDKFNGYWIIGFDTNHHSDNLENCSLDFVSNEVVRLLEQCLSDDIVGIDKYKTTYLRKDKLKKIDKNINHM